MKSRILNSTLLASLSFIIICVLLFSSCSLQKRRYLKGFYIEHLGKKQENKTLISGASEDIKPNPTSLYQASSINTPELVSENKNLITTYTLANNVCDTIIFTNGVKMFAKVISAGEETIIYKKCDSNKDELLNMESSKVKSIHYASGAVIDLNAPSQNPADDYNKPQKPFNSAKNAEAEKGVKQLERASYWFLLSRYIGFGFIVGFILAVSAKNKLENKPGYEAEYKLAKMYTILGLVLLLLIMIPIVYFIVISIA